MIMLTRRKRKREKKKSGRTGEGPDEVEERMKKNGKKLTGRSRE
ncbi:hypothetical protein SLEP1_g20532 [Rubroshorea leprosula]|uniref:Uncharacterized protein n=1 Tax=Rubroshorea leprosula TaxID=152421 RepID=A0AAV5J304_9ROSI|nr:hypothetical protein SLEP1_g20532 [Rubroshorea leprosula]